MIEIESRAALPATPGTVASRVAIRPRRPDSFAIAATRRSTSRGISSISRTSATTIPPTATATQPSAAGTSGSTPVTTTSPPTSSAAM